MCVCIYIYIYIYNLLSYLFWAVLCLYCCMQTAVFIFSSMESIGYPSCCVQVSHCGGFSCCKAWAPGFVGFNTVVCGLSTSASWALEHRFNSFGTWAQFLHSLWDLPGPGFELMSLALTGGFFTTEPPGNSCVIF